jgi:hypothetical protein
MLKPWDQIAGRTIVLMDPPLSPMLQPQRAARDARQSAAPSLRRLRSIIGIGQSRALASDGCVFLLFVSGRTNLRKVPRSGTTVKAPPSGRGNQPILRSGPLGPARSG